MYVCSPAGAAALPNVPPEAIASLSLVMLVSEHRVQKLAAMYPQVCCSSAPTLPAQPARRAAHTDARPCACTNHATPLYTLGLLWLCRGSPHGHSLTANHSPCHAVATPLQVLAMPPAEVAARLVLLKDLLPDSDVARMVELAPGWVRLASLHCVLALHCPCCSN